MSTINDFMENAKTIAKNACDRGADFVVFSIQAGAHVNGYGISAGGGKNYGLTITRYGDVLLSSGLGAGTTVEGGNDRLDAGLDVGITATAGVVRGDKLSKNALNEFIIQASSEGQLGVNVGLFNAGYGQLVTADNQTADEGYVGVGRQWNLSPESKIKIIPGVNTASSDTRLIYSDPNQVDSITDAMKTIDIPDIIGQTIGIQVGAPLGTGGASQKTTDSAGNLIREVTQLESFVSSHMQGNLDKGQIAQVATCVHSDLLNHARVALPPEMEREVKKLVLEYRQENPNKHLTNPADEVKQDRRVQGISSQNGEAIGRDTTVSSTKIGDLRRTLNNQMNETDKQLSELSQLRDQVKGAPLTKEQAEKLAASNHLNGADRELDRKAQELQAKQDKLSQYKEDTMKYGKENGLDTTLWRHAPEIFKGEGLKHYESSMATVENNTKVYDRQAAEIQAKRDEHQTRLQTPEAKSEIAKKTEEILAQDKERLAKLEALDRKVNELTNEKHDIVALKNIIPSRKLYNEIKIQGDANDVKNLLGQTDQIKQQVADMQPAQVQSRGRSM